MRKVREYLSVEVTHPRLVILIGMILFMAVGMTLGAVLAKKVQGHKQVSVKIGK